MKKTCTRCNTELFKDETGELFCPECYANEFLNTFNEKDDSDVKNNKWKVIAPKTKPITIRIPLKDLEKLKSMAKLKNTPYQKLLKGIIHTYLIDNAG